jgi:hypothetical protein
MPMKGSAHGHRSAAPSRPAAACAELGARIAIIEIVMPATAGIQ